MDESYLEKKAASERLYADVAASAIEESTPSDITSLIRRFADQLKDNAIPAFVPVVKDQYGLYGYCSDGVLEKIKHDGGDIAFGWCIWEWPKILFTAEFHAVWMVPSGELVDITPKPNGENRILFVQDDSYASDFDFDHRPLNKRICAVETPEPGLYAAERLASMKPSQRLYEESRAQKAGQTIKEWLASRMPIDPRIGLIERFIVACDEVDRLMDAAPKMKRSTLHCSERRKFSVM